MSHFHALGDLYTQDISNCFNTPDTNNGIDESDFNRHVQALKSGVDHIRTQYAEHALPLWQLPEKIDDLPQMAEIANRLQTYDNVVVLGTGGSSLGAQALQLLAGYQAGKSLHIVANVDPFVFHQKMSNLDFSKTGFLVISKSGETTETIMQFLTILPQIREQIPHHKIRDHVVFITENTDNSLRTLASRFGCDVLDHDPNVGGRYSVLSNVGLLPALIMGLPAHELRHGAGAVLQNLLTEENPAKMAPVAGSALNLSVMDKGMNNTVMLAYSDRLGSLARWHRQLWAESLGKNGNGTTPIYAMGPVDQHSQLQLWLDGPRDKLFNVLSHPMIDTESHAPTADDELDHVENLRYMKNCTLGDLMNQSRRATANTLIENGLPVRQLIMDKPAMVNMGALMMHFVLETVLTAHALGINPYDQPAVERGKVLLKRYMMGID